LDASQASMPPSSGRTLVIPFARSSSATRALVASLGLRAVEDDVAVPGNLSVAVFDLPYLYEAHPGSFEETPRYPWAGASPRLK